MKAKVESKEGGAAIFLLILVMVVPAIIGSYAVFSMNNQRNTQRAIHYMEAKIIAENAVSVGAETFFQKLKKTPTIDHGSLQRGLNRSGLVRGIKGRALTSRKASQGYMVDVVHFSNSRVGRTNLVDIVVAAENTLSGTKVAFLATYKVVELSFLDYAIFSDGIFELAPWPKMYIHGDVRVNDKIRIGAKYGLYFYDTLWSAAQVGVVPAWRKNEATNAKKIFIVGDDGVARSFYYGGEVLDGSNPNWETVSRSRWGEDVVKGNVPALEVPTTTSDNHVLIEPRDIVNDDATLMREKLSWKATSSRGVVITVDRTGTVCYEERGNGIRHAALPMIDIAEPISKDTGNGVYELREYRVGGKRVSGWIDVDNSFMDGRETGAGVRVVNVYMDKLLEKFPGKNIFYIEVEDENGNLTPFLDAKSANPSLRLPAVRIRNGNDISGAGNGLTIATHRMAYIEGNYNRADKVPALVAADNVTVLSNGWNDGFKGTPRPNCALDTWYQAAFLVGGSSYRNSSPSESIEGFQNLVRYRENWGGLHKTYYYDGSYVKLFNSKETTGAANNAYFRAPDRVITYNSDFVAHPPPGMPTALASPEIVQWHEIGWDEAQALAQ